MNKDLKLSRYYYDLPDELIAKRPAEERHKSRLFVYNRSVDKVIHSNFLSLAYFLPKYSTLVLNDSKVFPSRLRGKKSTGGNVEVLLLEIKQTQGCYKAMLKSNGKKPVGLEIDLSSGFKALVKRREGNVFFLQFNESLERILEVCGRIPLPPYIRKGRADERDRADYQTLFAKHLGSVAAPTAGLHFNNKVFRTLEERHIQRAYVTLHVGAGTFETVKSESITSHNMHKETYFIDKENADKIQRAQKIFAVGTTSLRVLEKSQRVGGIVPNRIEQTDIFLYPGVEVQSIHGLVTNFHLPYSTLLMLVSALIGREKALALYKEAVCNKYRFTSYGDAMLILL